MEKASRVNFLFIWIFLICTTSSASQSAVGDSSPPKRPDAGEYALETVLVKVREGRALEKTLEKMGLSGIPATRVYPIKPVVRKYLKTYPSNYRPTSDEEVFKAAYHAMPESERALYRLYSLTVPKDMSVTELIARLNESPDVEYAEPNSKVHAYQERGQVLT
jgi:hypothetical protein